MTIRYEAATAKDLAQMVELLGRLFEQEAEFTANAAKQETALKMILADPKTGRLYVAKDASRVVAMASLLFTVSTAEGGKAALFEDLVVSPDYRKQGIGAKLLEYVIGQARTEGVLRLTLLTDMQNERARCSTASSASSARL